MIKRSLVSLAAGSALAAAALSPAQAANGNPFEAKPMHAGYQVADAGDKMKEASCGADKAKAAKTMADDKMKAKTMSDDKMKPTKQTEASCGGKK